MPEAFFVVPGSLDALSGGSIYDRRMVEGLRARGWAVQVRELGSPADAEAALATLPGRGAVVVDGLIYGAMPDAVERQADRLRFVALVHMPLASEWGLGPDRARALEESERRALGCASRIVVTGRTTIGALAAFGADVGRAHVVEPGTDPAPIARGSGLATPQLLCVAAFSPGKGHAILLSALEANRSRGWHLTCVGDVRRSPGTVARFEEAVARGRLQDRVTVTGLLSGGALGAHYDRADAFVLATLGETYGMAVAEALARGLPVLSTSTGAIPSLVGDDAGLLVNPGDPDALAAAIGRFLDDGDLRGRLRDGARRVRSGLRTWDDAAAEMAAVLEPVAPHG